MTHDSKSAAETRQMELTVLIPCLNEAETLASCINSAVTCIRKNAVQGEVLVADNGSADGSQAIARACGARVVQVEERGYGTALQKGIFESKGHFVIIGDADGSHDFGELMTFMEKLRDGYEFVVGNRFAGVMAPNAMPFLHRYLGNPLLSFLGRLFFNIPLKDFHCGFRGFDKTQVQDLGCHTPGMEFASEMIVKAALHGLSMTEVPVSVVKDKRSRPPHLRTWRDGWRHLCFLLVHAPRWLFVYPGLVILCAGLLISLSLLQSDITLGQIVFSTKTFVSGCLGIIVGLQYLTFGLITRQYTAVSGILPPSPRHSALLKCISRDTLLLAALLFLLIAGALFLWSLNQEVDPSLNPLDSGFADRLKLLSLTSLASAMQTFMAGFMSAVMHIRCPTTPTKKNAIPSPE